MPSSTITHSLVSDVDSLGSFLVRASMLPVNQPCLFVDLEGVNLSRNGTISIITIYVKADNHVYLIDVHTLKSLAFTYFVPNDKTSSNNNGVDTLKDLLESPSVIKVFYDVRNDSDALYAHFGIMLAGIEDVQLMENACRPGRRRFVMGLEKCIDNFATSMTYRDKMDWKTTKEAGVRLFHPERGGTYEVFNKRPMDEVVAKYCINDVVYLAELRDGFWARLTGEWKEKVKLETLKRVAESQSARYDPHSELKKFGPWPFI